MGHQVGDGGVVREVLEPHGLLARWTLVLVDALAAQFALDTCSASTGPLLVSTAFSLIPVPYLNPKAFHLLPV